MSPDEPKRGMERGTIGPEGLPARDRPGGTGETDPVGPFPSWGALYTTVVVYALAVVLLLYLFTLFLNVGTTP